MSVWPVTLPAPLEGGSGGKDPNHLEFQTDGGPYKVRRLSTKPTNARKVVFVINDTQLATFNTFYDDTLGGGVLSFEWVDPSTQSTVSAYIVGKPGWKNISGGKNSGDQKYELTLTMEFI